MIEIEIIDKGEYINFVIEDDWNDLIGTCETYIKTYYVDQYAWTNRDRLIKFLKYQFEREVNMKYQVYFIRDEF